MYSYNKTNEMLGLLNVKFLLHVSVFFGHPREGIKQTKPINTLRTGLLNCLNARSRGLTFRHRASCI